MSHPHPNCGKYSDTFLSYKPNKFHLRSPLTLQVNRVTAMCSICESVCEQNQRCLCATRDHQLTKKKGCQRKKKFENHCPRRMKAARACHYTITIVINVEEAPVPSAWCMWQQILGIDLPSIVPKDRVQYAVKIDYFDFRSKIFNNLMCHL